MANPTSVETVTTSADKAKLAVAVLLLIGGLAAYPAGQTGRLPLNGAR